ncbi:endolytic transglycosylase MltG [Ahniella affigens]|uniref:endolytic transglycosylase MltG n=1 Tax=Ahniella affigens TaxID=2021234 RepID=UPI00197D4BC1|nr:endolytic transglycosylase MltG [Ahniella affigens]
MRKLIRRLFLLGLVGLVVAGLWFYRDYKAFSDAPMPLDGHEVVVDVSMGTSFNQIVRQLTQAGATNAPREYWRLLATELGVIRTLRAGEYLLEPGMTPRQLLTRMAKGKVILHQFTIVEGWTFRELRLALSKAEKLKQTLSGLSDQDIMARVGKPGQHPEGRFLPETYSFVRGQQDIDILKRAFSAMEETLLKEWGQRAQDSPLTSPEDLLILASIVEKETGRADDRGPIAGVFSRRLKIGMRLQTDPTVIYGLGSSFNGNLTRRHLETDGPYNSYTRAGLPPTPIALPGKEAIAAAARPAPGDALYFVAKGDGASHFSATLGEHNEAVRRYQLQ